VHGLVSSRVELTLDEYLALEHRDLSFDIHCVTSWTRLDSQWSGIPLREVLAMAQPGSSARYVSFKAFSQRDHHTSLPIDFAMENSWLVHIFDGAPLSTEHGGPVRLVTPGKYFYKSLKWLKGIELLAEDRLGWWEINSAYHNNADPWAGNERFTTGSLRPEQLERFKSASNYDKYRGRVLLGLDLREWIPSTSQLSRLYLKNCDLRGVDLTGADMKTSNLSLSDLSGAVLAGVDLAGSDLEGVNFGSADLRGANLSGTALSATRFETARVEGAIFSGSWGLVESQRAYLVERGVAL
jgi:hypothetical protein